MLSVFAILPSDLNRIIATAPHRYKVFYIPKKRSGELREIAQPAIEVKALQRWVVGYLGKILPIHECAMAYREGVGIKHNAIRHSGNRFVLKMDFSNFFPSITYRDMTDHLRKFGGAELSDDDMADIGRIVLWTPKGERQKRLCVGAPSSPFISNTILFDIDTRIYDYCRGLDVAYTRYADDLVFSTNAPDVLRHVEQYVYKTLEQADYPRISVNREKTVHTSKGKGILVTGVVVTPLGKISLGRERKRRISSAIHRFTRHMLSPDEVRKLNGLLAFAHDIEPTFIDSMKNKYGVDVIVRIRNSVHQSD
jgi:hypothetical protein